MPHLIQSSKAVNSSGIIHSIAASFLFAIMPAYIQLMPPVHGYALLGQRILWTTLIIFILLLIGRRLRDVISPLLDINNLPGLITGSLLVGLQWGIFVWAPLNNETLGLAMGYSLLPLVLVLIGRFRFKESLSKIQWFATWLAVLAVAVNVFQAGYFSWVAILIALGYPPYFILRRKQPIPVISAFFIENLLLLPFAWWACVAYGPAQHPFAYPAFTLILFSGVGILGSLGMLALLSASRKLPVGLFGLLGYLEPLFLFLIGVFIVGETIQANEVASYFLIASVVLLLVIDGVIKLRSLERTRTLP